MDFRPTQQPFLGIETAVTGLFVLMAAWGANLLRSRGVIELSDVVLALCLVASVVLAYFFAIQVRQETKVGMTSVPLFLMATLLPVPLAVSAIGLGVLVSELAIRSQSGTYPSDIAVQAGRWMVVGLTGSLVAHLSLPLQNGELLRLFGAALVMWLGDVVTSPILLSPATGEPPLTVMRMVVREAGAVEAAQYVVGILGVLASRETIWAVALLILPTALVYVSFKSVKDLHERTRRLLASFVETSSDAILLLDLEGTILTANRQAAVLYGRSAGEELAGASVFRAIAEDDRERALADMRTTYERGTVQTVEYSMLRDDGTAFPGELSWSVVRDEQGRPTGVTSLVRDITERRRVTDALAHRAQHDTLTGLPNRSLFGERLEQALIRAQQIETPLSVFLTDLDRFKQVNDTFGHHFGDELLKNVARRIQRVLRETDTVARLGGDELAVLLPKADERGAALVASRIARAVAEPVVIEGQRLEVGISIGIAVFPEDGADGERLMQRADAAMYAAKRAGRDYAFHDESPLVVSELSCR